MSRVGIQSGHRYSLSLKSPPSGSGSLSVSLLCVSIAYPHHDFGENDSKYENAAIEYLSDPVLGAEEREAVDCDGDEKDADHRTDDVRISGLDGGLAEEYSSEGRE